MDRRKNAIETLLSVVALPAVKAVLGPIEIHASVEAIKALEELSRADSKLEESE